MWVNRAGQRSAIRINSTHTVDESGCGIGIGGCEIIAAFQAARRYCFPRTQGGSPGLKDNAPLALKENSDFSLGVSISSKAPVSIAKTGSTIFHGEPEILSRLSLSHFTRYASRFILYSSFFLIFPFFPRHIF